MLGGLFRAEATTFAAFFVLRVRPHRYVPQFYCAPVFIRSRCARFGINEFHAEKAEKNNVA